MFWLCQYMPVINSLLYHSKLYLQAMDCFICNGRTNWVLFINEITLEIYLDVQSRAVFTGCFSSNWPLLTWNKDYKVFASIHQAFYIPLPPLPFHLHWSIFFKDWTALTFIFEVLLPAWGCANCLNMCTAILCKIFILHRTVGLPSLNWHWSFSVHLNIIAITLIYIYRVIWYATVNLKISIANIILLEHYWSISFLNISFACCVRHC